MKQLNNLKTHPVNPFPLGKRMLTGAVIALVLIIIFLVNAGEPGPGWAKLWYIRPLIVVPLSGALGGAFYYFMDHMRYQGGSRKIMANILSLAVYIIVFWAGMVTGLNGTWWD